jgi:predicted nucleic acid-binding protein
MRSIAALLEPLLQLPGLRLPRKRSCLTALDLWAQTPSISFVDALGASLATELRTALATFDRRLTRVPGVVQWERQGGSR